MDGFRVGTNNLVTWNPIALVRRVDPASSMLGASSRRHWQFGNDFTLSNWTHLAGQMSKRKGSYIGHAWPQTANFVRSSTGLSVPTYSQSSHPRFLGPNDPSVRLLVA